MCCGSCVYGLFLLFFFPPFLKGKEEGNFEITSLKASKAVNLKNTMKIPFQCLSVMADGEGI